MARPAACDLLQHRRRRADLARRAAPALEPVSRDKGALQRRKIVRLTQSLDRRDHISVVHARECEAGIDPPPVHNDGAGTALAVIASLLGARQPQMVAQRIQKRRTRISVDPMFRAVDPEIGLDVLSPCPAVCEATSGSQLGADNPCQGVRTARHTTSGSPSANRRWIHQFKAQYRRTFASRLPGLGVPAEPNGARAERTLQGHANLA